MSRVLAQLKKSTTVLRTAVRSKSDHALTYPQVTMDDMPVPTVPYKEFYSKNNAKYNAILVGGIASLAISIYILQDNCFFNAFEPPYPFEEGKN